MSSICPSLVPFVNWHTSGISVHVFVGYTVIVGDISLWSLGLYGGGALGVDANKLRNERLRDKGNTLRGGIWKRSMKAIRKNQMKSSPLRRRGAHGSGDSPRPHRSVVINIYANITSCWSDFESRVNPLIYCNTRDSWAMKLTYGLFTNDKNAMLTED